MTQTLESKVAFVTGSASGIGEACFVAVAIEGARVAIANLDLVGAT